LYGFELVLVPCDIFDVQLKCCNHGIAMEYEEPICSDDQNSDLVQTPINQAFGYKDNHEIKMATVMQQLHLLEHFSKSLPSHIWLYDEEPSRPFGIP
jgi:hypothetical protein